MTIPIASTLTRMPNLLRTQLSLSSLNRTNLDLFRINEQLSTGRAISRVSQDSVRAALITTLDSDLERADQLRRNLNVADSSLATIDQALGEATDLLLEAKSIGLEQVGSLTTDEERKALAQVVNSMITGLAGIANRTSQVGYVFAGSTPGGPAVEAFGSGYRYLGSGGGLLTDLGPAGDIPVTLGAGSVIGSASSRVQGTADLSPTLTDDTRLADLRGARGLGVALGFVEYTYDSGPARRVDVSGADTIADVADLVEADLRTLEGELGTTILGAGGVGVGESGLTIAIDPGAGGVRFLEVGEGTTARDLGLAGDPAFDFGPGNSNGLALDPELTWESPVTLAPGESLGRLRLSAGGRTAVVDLSSAETIGDVRRAIEATGVGVRVEINDARNGINVRYEVAGGVAGALSISEVTGEGGTASLLGIRTLDLGTSLAAFDDGRGVSVVSGVPDPETGQISAALNVDFDITLGDGTVLSIDLAPEDTTNVETLLAAINAQADTQLTAAGLPTTAFAAGLNDGANGIAFEQDAALGGSVSVTQRNNSQAARALGLLDGGYDATSGVYLGADAARVRVDNAFTHLIDLRDALLAGDEIGIGLATESLERDLDRVTEARGMVGGLSRRVQQETDVLENRKVLNESMRSELRDTDFAEAATKYALLQSQLQASLQVAATANSLSLLDFI